MTVQARMRVLSNVVIGQRSTGGAMARKVQLQAIYSADPADPNYSFAEATPDAQLNLTITNPDAYDQLVAGEVYDLSLERVAASAPRPLAEQLPPTDPTTQVASAVTAPAETVPAGTVVPGPTGSSEQAGSGEQPGDGQHADSAS